MELTRAAIFDLDGTLVLTEERNRVVWQRFFTAYDIDLTDQIARQLTGRRGPDALRELTHLFPGRDPQDLFAEVLAHELADDLPAITAVPGGADLVRALGEAGVPLALVTSASGHQVTQRLDSIGVGGCFDVVVTGADVSVGKPDPEGFTRAGDLLGVPPSRCVGFEDSPAGVAAVKAAGMVCVAVTTTFDAEVLRAADVIVPDLTEFPWPVAEVA